MEAAMGQLFGAVIPHLRKYPAEDQRVVVSQIVERARVAVQQMQTQSIGWSAGDLGEVLAEYLSGFADNRPDHASRAVVRQLGMPSLGHKKNYPRVDLVAAGQAMRAYVQPGSAVEHVLELDDSRHVLETLGHAIGPVAVRLAVIPQLFETFRKAGSVFRATSKDSGLRVDWYSDEAEREALRMITSERMPVNVGFPVIQVRRTHEIDAGISGGNVDPPDLVD
jgi:hypothetical protein